MVKSLSQLRDSISDIESNARSAAWAAESALQAIDEIEKKEVKFSRAESRFACILLPVRANGSIVEDSLCRMIAACETPQQAEFIAKCANESGAR
jgi:hypothetical protein